MDEEKHESVKVYSERINQLVDDFEHQIYSQLNHEYARSTKWPDTLTDRIAEFGGSWRFIILFFLVLVLWVSVNSLPLTKVIRFDAPPFILLNLLLSFLAGFQAPIIIMSQNRQAARDKHEQIMEFAIDYKAEQEIHDMQGHLHRLEDDFAAFRAEMKEELAEIKKLIAGEENR